MMDPITDMLNQIRNAQAVKKAEVLVSLSKLKYEIAKILSREGFVGEIKKGRPEGHPGWPKGKNKAMKIALKYSHGVSAISGLRRVSRSGQRIYRKASEIKKVHGGSGISIISTPKGLMTNKEARKQKLGGEIICEVW